MRRLLLVLAVSLGLALPQAAAAGSLFLVSGRGWGHGVGLSQYGAWGFAQNGMPYDQILAHYYPGTTLGPAPVAQVRVLVAENRKVVRIGSAAPFKATDASGAAYDVPAGAYELGADLTLVLPDKSVTLAPPVRFEPGDAPLELGRPYRGALVLLSNGKRVSAVDYVGLEQYLYGVVPGEMPADWTPAALEAQAVAARSYALANLAVAGDFDLYSDTRSQVYRGIAVEDARTTAAVDATSGQVVLFDGQVAETFFFSTSGGRTAAAADVWGKPFPYLVSVDDPYDTLSPYHEWGPVLFTGKELAQQLGALAPHAVRDLTVGQDSSGRAAAVTLVGDVTSTQVSGVDLRRLLGLRSTWFDVGVLTLDAEKPLLVFGEKAVLRGVARGAGGVTLERKVLGGAWEPAGEPKVQEDGTFAVPLGKLRLSTAFRLTSPATPGLPARIRVAARVVLDPPKGHKSLRGRVRPKAEGTAVEIQRLGQDGSWTPVAETATDAAGEFKAKLLLEPGVYRAVASPGGGLLPGTSAELDLSSA